MQAGALPDHAQLQRAAMARRAADVLLGQFESFSSAAAGGGAGMGAAGGSVMPALDWELGVAVEEVAPLLLGLETPAQVIDPSCYLLPPWCYR